jgi:site-specific DNA-methyltransferase (adenine-specific)
MAVTVQGTRDIPIAAPTRYPGNPRRGNVEQIRASVRRLGQYRPIVVRDTGDALVILAGNHTTAALEAEGHEAVRAEVIRCDDDEARRINLADNRLAELGGYDDDDLAALLASLDGDFDGTGWAQDDLDALPGDDPGPGNTDPDDVPEPPAEPVTRPGDLWQLGPHRLLCGDSTDMAAVEKMLDGDRCDCMWTDPPYGVEYVGKTKDALTIRNDGADNLPALLAGAFAVATAALKPGAAVYVAHPAGALHRQFLEAFFAAGWRFHEGLIWDKGTMVLGHSDYHFRHEPIMYGYTAGEGRRGRGGEGWYGDHSQTSVFEVPKPSRSEDHPTMKPVALVQAMLPNSCPRNGLVYEPFGGSGSTLIAAHGLGLIARLIELDPRYCDVICQRYEQHTGIKPELVR